MNMSAPTKMVLCWISLPSTQIVGRLSCFRAGAPYSHLDSVPDGNLAILRKKLNIRVHEFDEFEGPSSSVFEFCPRLREAFIHASTYGGDDPTNLHLPFSQLQRYSGSNSWDYYHQVTAAPSPFHLNDADPGVHRYPCAPGVVLQSPFLHSFLAKLITLQKLVVPDTKTAADIGLLLHSAPTVTNLCLYIPMVFASGLFTLLANPGQSNPEIPKIPALQAFAPCLVPQTHNGGAPVDQDQPVRMLEAQWRDGHLRSFTLYGLKFVTTSNTIERMNSLRAGGMQMVTWGKSSEFYRNVLGLVRPVRSLL
ncbi:hypothetical protein C8F04DRAFT_1235709 [Mycena alexandri]|uniref:Uncharacterized protein n=1 Tax=Mycena alexandri TaxID=1745969 RepID=A0AAD6SQJ5_9AGAR|nr:hypothetical protein C8F04DRAFT_1235709 [Mycena alexandri]